MKAYSVVELKKGANETSLKLDNNKLFSTRENALEYLHKRYLDVRLIVDVGAGEFEADYSDDGWYSVVENDDTIYEGYVSEALEIN